MKKLLKKISIVLTLYLGLLLWGHEISEAVDFVKNGHSKTAIIIPEKPFNVVEIAAQELQYFIERSTGTRIPIFKENNAPEGIPCIYIGKCKKTISLCLKEKQFSTNEYCIKLIGNDLYIVGDDSTGVTFGFLHTNRTRVGTLFGVYEFLEKQLNVLWLWPGKLGEVVPPRKDISIEFWNQVGKPAFIHTRWRDSSPLLFGNTGWVSSAERDRFFKEQGKWLRRHRFAMGGNLDIKHAFSQWWKTYREVRSDFFNLLPDGTRRSDPNYHGGSPTLISMCLSNPDLHKRIVKKWIEKCGEPSCSNKYIDASENDTPIKCTCFSCMKWDNSNSSIVDQNINTRLKLAKKSFLSNDEFWYHHLGSLSDRYAKFLLSIQEQAKKFEPNAVVMGLAYKNYYSPPKHTKLNNRTIIGVVPPIKLGWDYAGREENRRNWDGWYYTGAKLLLRPNWMLEGHNMPIFFARKLGEDFRYFANRGLLGTDFDSLTGQYGTQGPNLYMVARLSAHPELSVDEVLDEYYSGFGGAKGLVEQYFSYWEEINNSIAERTREFHWAQFYNQAISIYTKDVMQRGQDILDMAINGAGNNPLVQQRLSFLKRGLKHAELTLDTQRAYLDYEKKGEVYPFQKALKQLDEYRGTIESHNIANMSFLFGVESRTWRRAF